MNAPRFAGLNYAGFAVEAIFINQHHHGPCDIVRFQSRQILKAGTSASETPLSLWVKYRS
ncbi:hypothetical protein XI09_06615 [Bradyrhizobium sp. CCBAU 11386]|nr:hypothetical protein [Bradyrhizobium sp. CCBAU 11386]